MSIATPEKIISSIYPEDELRQIPIPRAAHLLSFELDRVRSREDYSFAQAVEDFVAEHGATIQCQASADQLG